MKTSTAVAVCVVIVVAAAGCSSRSLKKEVMLPPAAEILPQPNSPVIKETTPAILDDNIADRIVAVVNNDAITQVELQETVAAVKHETQQSSTPDTELANQILTKLIDSRLQLQEAERDKVVVDDAEVTEELNERMKKLGSPSQREFEDMLRAQGITMESVRRRIRDGLRIERVKRRKVALRVSVTEAEIDQYLEQNRRKLETGLSYHARHLLIVPEGSSPAAWEAARLRAEIIRQRLLEGADFAELARQNSGDATAKDGGDLGTMKRGELDQEIEAQIVKMLPGEVSQPYRSPLGYHIFRLEALETLQGDALVRVQQQIRDILFREKYDARFDAWLKEVKQRAIIEKRL